MKLVSKINGLVIGVIFASQAASAVDVKVNVVTVPEEVWEAKELALVKKAADVVFDRIAEHSVAQCAYRNSFRDDMTTDQLRQKWGNQIPVLNKRPEITLTIHKKPMDNKILGLAKVGTAKVDKKEYRIDNLDIALNQETINRHSEIYSKKTKSSDVLNQWVNVIAHELAHNFGYGHGTTGNWTTDYPGYFVTELGFCVMTDGKFGSDLGDENLRRERISQFKR